jgi:hypothetical protein
MAKKQQSDLLDDEEDIIDDEAGKVVFVLCRKNDARGRVFDADGNPIKDPEYSKRRNLLLRSSVNWRGDKDPFTGKDRPKGRYLIRYYDGCTTLFIDDQPKDPAMLEPMMAGTRELHFNHGYLAVDEYDTMLITYCKWASWNEGSPYRNKRVEAIFKLLDTEEMRREEASNMDKVEEALGLAKKAAVKHMRVHARYLGVDEIDSQTMRALSDDAIRTEYRKAAMHNPAEFIKTYNDKSIHLKHWINLATASGDLSFTIIPNRVVWAKIGVEVCDTTGLTTNEGILNRLIELAKTDQGAEFRERLETLYGKR